jgi:hypothetical protein
MILPTLLLNAPDLEKMLAAAGATRKGRRVVTIFGEF